jgi:SAM-dependent methyltransferase
MWKEMVMESLYYEIFESLPRQGPGDDASTRKAFQKLVGLPEHPEILDVGCGSGKQTLALAQLASGKITALDNHPPFIALLGLHASSGSFPSQIVTTVGDMGSMKFKEGSFDLIWAEGAAYIIGFHNALERWKPFLRPKGYLVISEIVWFTRTPPQEISDYWTEEYLGIKYYEDHYPVVESSGYTLIDYFPLPGASWWTDYYGTLEARVTVLRKKHEDNPEAQAILDSFQLEMDMHKKYSEHYGYGFFIMQRVD